MLFHSIEFFYLFVVTFGGYWAIKQHRLRKLWLLAASLGFYGTWNPWLLFVIVFSAAFDFAIAQKIEQSSAPARRRQLLVVSVCVSLGILAFFKYTNFLLDNAIGALNLFGFDTRHPAFAIVLPLGISFYTFETISYVVDVYRGRLRAERNFFDYALFIMFFPHLIAGPIVRPRHFLRQVPVPKRFDWNRLELGARLFILGLVKKAVIADHMAVLVDPVFAAPGAYSSSAVWVAVLCYAIQIYCDFSGYSDMAVGTAHAFGYKLPDNFNMPYAASNITEFWHRWHISLSTWLRDYLYIPLGGNRFGTAATYRNLMLTMILGGLWHGAGWNFLLWGSYHGLLLSAHRAIARHTASARTFPKPPAIAVTFFCVCVGWVFFRAESIGQALTILQRMLTPSGGQRFDSASLAVALAAWLAVILGHSITLNVDLPLLFRRLPAPVLATGIAAVFLVAQILMPQKGATFIYFQF
jgi:alginate O-acetyltransferase complex protein AlgI